MTDKHLLGESPPGPHDDAVAGVIYNYGMTMYLIQVLEHQVVNLIVASNLPRRECLATGELSRVREKAFRQTLGLALKELTACVNLPADLGEKLDGIVLKRNELAHRFFREHYKEMQSVSSNERLVRELADLQQFVVNVDDELTQLERSMWRESGMDYPF
jgi:hypothetical protein